MRGKLRVSSPPLRDQSFTQAWIDALANAFTAISGEWGEVDANLTESGLTYDSKSIDLNYQGGVVHFLASFDNLTSSAGSLTLGFTAKETILDTIDRDSLTNLSGAPVSGSTITIPNLSGQNVLFKGVLLKNG